MSRRSCPTKLIIAEEFPTGMSDPGEPVDVVYQYFSKTSDLVCLRLLVKNCQVWFSGDPSENNPLGGRVSEEQNIKSEFGRPSLERSYRKSSVFQVSVLELLLFLIFLNDQVDLLIQSFADDV